MGDPPPAFAPRDVAPVAPLAQPRKGNRGVVLILVGAGALFVLLFLGAVGWGAFYFAKGFAKADSTRRAQNANPGAVALSESFASKNGLIRAHYPADFAAKHVGEQAVVVTRVVGLSEEGISLSAVKKPITDDAGELSRIYEVEMQKAMEAKGGTYVSGEPGAALCATSASSHDGVQRVSSYQLLGQDYRLWSCTFLAGGHGYRIGYVASKTNLATDRPLLKRIVEATELTQ